MLTKVKRLLKLKRAKWMATYHEKLYQLNMGLIDDVETVPQGNLTKSLIAKYDARAKKHAAACMEWERVHLILSKRR